jgi:HK97 family phage portal protein
MSTVSRKDALRHSAVWACLRLRADIISSMPVDVFRRIDGVQVEQPKPPILITPGGKRLRWKEFVYSTQVDVDSVGNTVGIVTARDGRQLPAEIELACIDDVTFLGRGAYVEGIRIGRTTYDPPDVWHEKQFTVSGVPVGLSPIAHAAMSVNSYLSAQEFAADWFGNSVVPAGHLRNTAKTLVPSQALDHKANFEASVQHGGIFVSGNDWEYNMLAAKASESQFLEAQEFSVTDVCRFLGVPGDMIDAPVKGSAVTYANITQRNLQLLIMNIGPAIDRREEAWSAGLLPAPRYVKLNTGALLRMDIKSQLEAHGVAIEQRIYPPSRALELLNMDPLTEDEAAEFATLFPAKAAQPMNGVAP